MPGWEVKTPGSSSKNPAASSKMPGWGPYLPGCGWDLVDFSKFLPEMPGFILGELGS